MPFAPFAHPLVSERFRTLPAPLQQPLLNLRQTILNVAARLPVLGGLTETLKWHEPAYHPTRKRVGTTIRIDAHRHSPGCYALYVPCQTRLIAMFARNYPGSFTFEDNRAVVFETGSDLPLEPLNHCIAMALTYHLSRTVAG